MGGRRSLLTRDSRSRRAAWDVWALVPGGVSGTGQHPQWLIDAVSSCARLKTKAVNDFGLVRLRVPLRNINNRKEAPMKSREKTTWATVACCAVAGALLLPAAAQAKVVHCRDHQTTRSPSLSTHIVAHNLPTRRPCRLAYRLANDLETIGSSSHRGPHGIWIGDLPFSEAGFMWTFSYRVIRRDKFGNPAAEGYAITIKRSGTTQRVTYNQ
jgi:hypothetical protein